MPAENWVFFEEVAIISDTEKAFLIEHDGVQRWIPKSQIEDPDRLSVGDVGITLGITEFIAKGKGIET